jgi:LysM repeat protein
MKKTLLFLLIGVLSGMQNARTQDAAMEERLNKVSGQVADLIAAQEVQQHRIGEMAREIATLREQVAKPSGNFASQEEIRKLAEKIQEIDQKRVADNEKILKEIERLGRTGSGVRGESRKGKTGAETPGKGTATGGTENGLEHVIQSGDTLSTIALAYREKGIKVTAEQIQKANPNLKPTSLRVGQKIFIPVPAE